MNEIGFIGAGNMATAIIKGYIKHAVSDIFVYDINPEQVQRLAGIGAKPKASAGELAESVKYLFLAVKPQNFGEVLEELKGHVSTDTVVVSIAAGISSDYIKEGLGFDVKVVRVMPNTPLLLGCGASALAQIAPATEEEFSFCCEIFKASGEIAVVREDQINAIISVSGSTPAYIYQITKHFVDYAEESGLDRQMAISMFCQTLTGSAKMMTESGYSLDELIQMVSSKGGTTIAGLTSFAEDGLGDMIKKACDCCTKRAIELAK
ncbi:Pyrroline-5-carboxylate reductase [uncultured Ruminococcus sp.]|nr:Pyrroline-5-carboxylate reductase [uncultured Ruminococcus sp.]SCH81100.1 Pyrroline-5-carboxylate reductase [uncultured Clostridium sp.]